MSLPRVSSLETFMGVPQEGSTTRYRRGSDSSVGSASVRARKLTFNPLPESWNPSPAKRGGGGGGDDHHRHHHHPHAGHAVGAFEVPKWKRILQIAVTVIYCLFAAGVVFGYAALKPVLKKEGAYQDVCDGEDTCVEIHLNLMFTVAAVVTNVAALPVGAILDHFGPRVCGLLGALFLTVGALLMAFARDLPFDAFLSGYLFLALGGPFTYISAFQLSNAFPQNSGLVLALLTGAFDASSAMFLVYRVLYEKSDGAFGHHEFFLAYLVVPVVIVILQLTVLPGQSYKTVGEMIEDAGVAAPLPPQQPPPAAPTGPPLLGKKNAAATAAAVDADDQVDEQTALLREERRQAQLDRHEHVVHEIAAQADNQVHREAAANERSGVWGVMHTRSALRQMASPWWVLICLFTVVQMTRINYFVATIRPQYEALLGSEARAVEINQFFDLALPLGGIVSIPFIGGVLDRASTAAVLATLVAAATLIGVLGVLPYAPAAYAGICLFVLYRPFYYTAVSDYAAKVFGFRTFGTVYGTIICLSGLLNFSQSALDYLFHVACAGDPVPVNLGLLCLGLAVGVCLVGYVAVRARQLRGTRKRGVEDGGGLGEY
ncbi:FMP42 protein [Xylariomycetidae sp. FL2044]|nr:FMP42 protein [Xylariomycetidae sp. FL2044]